MKSGHSQRKLSNIRLTGRFHYQHMGLWILITCALLFVLNLLLYLSIVQVWSLMAQEMGGEIDLVPSPALLIGMLSEFFMFCVAVVYLAIFTSHRIAGPYIGLQRICEAIRDGDHAKRAHFRKGDRLEELETAFNEMVEALTRKSG